MDTPAVKDSGDGSSILEGKSALKGNPALKDSKDSPSSTNVSRGTSSAVG